MKELLLYLATVPVFFAIDMLWLSTIANKLYFDNIPNLRSQPNWFAAIVFYLIYIVGIIIFAVYPNLDQSWIRVLLYGAMFGFFAYATYDLTNYSTIKDWPLKITIIDIIWGTTLTGLVAVVSHYIATKWIY